MERVKTLILEILKQMNILFFLCQQLLQVNKHLLTQVEVLKADNESWHELWQKQFEQ